MTKRFLAGFCVALSAAWVLTANACLALPAQSERDGSKPASTADDKAQDAAGRRQTKIDAAAPLNDQDKETKAQLDVVEEGQQKLLSAQRAELGHTVSNAEQMTKMQQTIATVASLMGENNPTLINANLAFGIQLFYAGKTDQAIAVLARSLPQAEKTAGVDSRTVAMGNLLLGEAYMEQGQSAKALQPFAAAGALSAKSATDAGFHGIYGMALIGTARAYGKTGDYSRARVYLDKAKKL